MRLKGTIYFVLLLLFATSSLLLADVESVFDELNEGKNESSQAKVRLLTDNHDAWYARWHIIDNAKTSIDTTYYIIDKDAFGMSFLGLLLKKAKEGVSIRFMVDARGTAALSHSLLGLDLLQELAAFENVEIKVFNPFHKGLAGVLRNIRRPISCNHDKILLVDDKYLIVGGRNISKHYFAKPGSIEGVFRDTDVLLEGSEVASKARVAFEEEFASLSNYEVQEDWLGNWVSQNRELEIARRLMFGVMMGRGLPDLGELSNPDYFLPFFEEMEAFPNLNQYCDFRLWQGERHYPVTILDKHSHLGTRNDITKNVIRFIKEAQESIYIQNAYVVLTDDIREALVGASNRGVKIILSTNSPDSSDVLMTQVFFVQEWKKLLKDMPTCRIFCFKEEQKLHAKVFTFDEKISVIGTYNLDYMSDEINSEVVALIKSEPFCRQNNLRIDKDALNAVEYKIKVERDGEITELTGPADHCKQATMDMVERLGCLSFLRPLI